MLFLLSQMALAEGLSIDSQLFHPALSEDGVPGLNAAPYGMKGLVLGGVAQLEISPVQLHLPMGESQPLVDVRLSAAPVLAYQSGRYRLSLGLPLGRSLSSGQTQLSYDGGYRGNPMLSAEMRLTPGPQRSFPLRAGLRGTLYVPLGTPDSWAAEEWPRQSVSLNLLLPLDNVTAGAELGVLARKSMSEVYDFQAQNERFLRVGAVKPVGEFVSLTGTLLVRTMPDAQGWEENAAEVLFGIKVQGKSNAAGIGRGVTPGLGTSQARAWFAAPGIEVDQIGGFERKPNQDRVKLDVAEDPKPQTDYTVSRAVGMGGSSNTELSDEPIAVVSSNGLARVVDDRIEIREPIQFEVGTDRILEQSLPVLDAVAELMGQHPEIAHLAIVGHASAEGEHQSNYELSTQRARSVYEQLLMNGVHPKRLSFRGMGEVEPISEDAPDNRRVDFQIVHQLHPLDDPEALPMQAPLPWNGDLVPIVQPPPPSLPEDVEPSRPEIDPRTFDQEIQ